jgi:hypothetical protein
MNACVFDIDKGLIIKLAEGLEVVQAMKGMHKLSKDEIKTVYGNPPIFSSYEWPNTTHLHQNKGAYWVFMTFFDTPKVAVVLKAIDLIDRGIVKNKSYWDVAMDIRTMIFKNYVHYTDKEVLPIASFGKYFVEVLKNPSKYI